MNDRIKKLKLQAGIQDNPDQEGLDLFAELIVQECAALADCPCLVVPERADFWLTSLKRDASQASPHSLGCAGPAQTQHWAGT